jgi:RND superfamily putative drug exporter
MAGLPNLAATLGGWSARHRLAAIGAWLALVTATMLIGSAVGQVTMTHAEYGTGESGRALWLLADSGIKAPAQELVLVHDPVATGTGALQAAVREVVSGIQATGRVQDVRAPVVSPGGHDVLVQFAIKGDPDTSANRVQPVEDAVARASAANPGVRIEEFGDASANKWFNDTIVKDARRAEWTVVPLAIGILLVVFGALVAALLPVVLALTAFLAANGLLALISHAMHVDTSASSVMLLMGMAVGVDYCLFYLRREREERAKGAGREAALRTAAATSGRSVLISGSTVIVAMAGMFLAGMQLFDGFAIATISVVLIAVAGSVTVLPALMSLLGDKVELGRVPFLGRVSHPADGSRFWKVVLDRVLARPGVSALGAAGLLVTLAAPALTMHTENLNVQKMLPSSTPIVQNYEHIMAAFPGGPAPALVVVKAPDIRSASARQQIAALTSYRSSALGQPIETTVYPAVNIAAIQVPLAGSGADATSRQALSTLHDTIVPATVGKIQGGEALVGGNLAFSIDFNNQLHRGIVPVFLFVMGITFLLMMAAFRSVVIAATTIVLNLLSVAAAYGALTAVFVHGWGAALVGTKAPGAIESWIPLFVFVVLFGLSMDYNVFVVSRIKEAHDRGMPTKQAVAHGIRATAGVVTSAAIIMVAVFAVFGTLSLQQFKQLSVGLAVAVLLDATVVRGVLLPSVMALLGERNWYLPSLRGRPGLPDIGDPGHPRHPPRKQTRRSASDNRILRPPPEDLAPR